MSAAAMSPAAMSPAATMSAATTAAGVCFECEKRHDEDRIFLNPACLRCFAAVAADSSFGQAQ